MDRRLPVGSIALTERVTHEEFTARHRAVYVPGRHGRLPIASSRISAASSQASSARTM